MSRKALLLGYAHLRYVLGLPPEICEIIYSNLHCECKVRRYKTKKYPTFSVCKSKYHICNCLNLLSAGMMVLHCKGKEGHECICYNIKSSIYKSSICRSEEEHPCICSKGCCVAKHHICTCYVHYTDKIDYIESLDESIPIYKGLEMNISSCIVPPSNHKCVCSIKFDGYNVVSFTTSLCRCEQLHYCICKSYYDNTITIVPEDQRTRVRKCRALTHIFS